jgi:hypothetical protein
MEEEKPLTRGVLKEVLKEELKEYTKDVLLPAIDLRIENLALIVGRGFEGVDKRFDVIENRICKLENGQEKIFKRLEGVDREVVEDLKTRVQDIENLFAMPQKK